MNNGLCVSKTRFLFMLCSALFLLNISQLNSAEAPYRLLSSKELNARNVKFDATLRYDPNAIRKQAASLNLDALHAVRSHQTNQISFFPVRRKNCNRNRLETKFSF